MTTLAEWKVELIKKLLRAQDLADNIEASRQHTSAFAQQVAHVKPKTAHEAYDDAIAIIANAELPDDLRAAG